MKLIVVRIRGSVNVPERVRRLMTDLGLERPNNVVIIQGKDSYRGLLVKARHMITYGSPSKETIAALLTKRGEVKGYGRLDDQYVADHTTHSSIDDFAEALHQDEASLKDLPLLKRTFRCSPPSKGYRDLKRPYESGGAYGNRGEEIDQLLKRMI